MGLICVICTEDLCSNEEKRPVSIRNCGHVFHYESCLKEWLSRSHSCPVCREFTLDLPKYIGKLHFQRLSLDRSAVANTTIVENLLEENAEQRMQLERANEELERATEELAKAERALNSYKEKEKASKDLSNEIRVDMKQMEALREKISMYTHAMFSPAAVKIMSPRVTSNRSLLGASSSSSSSSSNNRNPTLTRPSTTATSLGAKASSRPMVLSLSRASNSASPRSSLPLDASLSSSSSSNRNLLARTSSLATSGRASSRAILPSATASRASNISLDRTSIPETSEITTNRNPISTRPSTNASRARPISTSRSSESSNSRASAGTRTAASARPATTLGAIPKR